MRPANFGLIRVTTVCRVTVERQCASNGEIVMHVTENLDLRGDIDHEVYCCVKCQTEVGLLGSNYKEHCIRIDKAVSKSNLLIGEPSRFIDDTPEFRQFILSWLRYFDRE